MSFVKNTYFGRHKHTWKCSQIKNTHTYKLELQLASFHACKSSDTNPPTSGRRQVVHMWCEHEMTHILEATWCYGGNVNVSVVGGIFYLGERDITQHYKPDKCAKKRLTFSHTFYTICTKQLSKPKWCDGSGWFRSGNWRSKMGHRIWSVIHTLAVRLTTCQTDHILLWRSILASDVNHEVHNMDSFSGLVCLSVAS